MENRDLSNDFLHICIPYFDEFHYTVKKYYSQYFPVKAIVIHSTVPPRTGEKLQDEIEVPVISSPIRGVHRNFENDLKKYIKWFGFNRNPDDEILELFKKRMSDIGIKLGLMTNGRTCELSKILCDTTYYGWMIVYRYITDWICKNNDVNSNEMWTMNNDAEEKPIMYSDKNGIGGHCVMPNLELLKDPEFEVFISKLIKNVDAQQKERYK